MSQAKEYYFKEGCYIQEWQNCSAQPGLSIARIRVEAGTQTKLHALKNTTERYVILSGTGEVTVGEKSWLVSEGDVINIAPLRAQMICNTSGENLIFLAICAPRFELENYVELE